MDFEVVSKAKSWKAIMGLILLLHEEAVFKINKDGIFFKVINTSNTEMIGCEWVKSQFIKFVCEKEYKNIGFRVDEFNKRVSRFADDADVSVISSSEQNKLIISSGEKSFDLYLSNLQMDSIPPSPKIGFELEFDINTNLFKDIIEDALVINDTLEIRTEDQKILLFNKGDSGTYTKTIENGSVKNGIRSKYSMEYLANVVKTASKFTDKIHVKMANQKLIWLVIKIEGMGIINYYLAPIRDPTTESNE